MLSESEIIRDIENKAIPLPAWTIGVTADPERRRQELYKPTIWYTWDAQTENSARNVEKYFLEKGMKRDTGGSFSSTYVYICLPDPCC